MARASKRLEAMRRNPVGDWTIDDVRTVCRSFGIAGHLQKPPGALLGIMIPWS
jgi:hypothetical protein